MADINFPNSPVDGQTYVYNGTTFTWVEIGASGVWKILTPGSVSVASATEINAGTDNAKYVTPLGLKNSDYELFDTIFNALYPIGAIFESTATTPPSLGTWTAITDDRVLVAAGSSYTLGATGGSKNAITISHNHTASFAGTAMSSHTHNMYGTASSAGSKVLPIMYTGSNNNVNTADMCISKSAGTPAGGVTVNYSGSSGTNANMQPYLAVNRWKRIA